MLMTGNIASYLFVPGLVAVSVSLAHSSVCQCDLSIVHRCQAAVSVFVLGFVGNIQGILFRSRAQLVCNSTCNRKTVVENLGGGGFGPFYVNRSAPGKLIPCPAPLRPL